MVKMLRLFPTNGATNNTHGCNPLEYKWNVTRVEGNNQMKRTSGYLLNGSQVERKRQERKSIHHTR